ncbi:MAG: helix-turn-helix transcriptional regulator [Paludibacteraceae bacterium]|nr:helix-turn-helix transcriptional regulator [Paludibacteraceae bacterium]
MKSELANTIKTLRKEYGLTQEDTARKAGVSLAFLRELEQGKTTARMDSVNKVLALFDYTLTPQPTKHEEG